MDELLEVLRRSLLFLFAENRYHLAHSQMNSPYGDALIRVDSSDLSWYLVRERSQVSLDLRWRDDTAKFGTDLVYELVEGRVAATSLLTDEIVGWIEANLDEIESRFVGAPDATRVRLNELKKERARRMFGPAPWET